MIKMNKRKFLIKRLLIFLSLGVAYYIWLMLTDIAIPCFIRLVTGFSCPGCGVSRMSLAILKGDFEAAFEANECLFILLPIWAVIIVIKLIFMPKALEQDSVVFKIICGFTIFLLITFGVLRNIFSI